LPVRIIGASVSSLYSSFDCFMVAVGFWKNIFDFFYK
jgi:hypothetical protein